VRGYKSKEPKRAILQEKTAGHYRILLEDGRLEFLTANRVFLNPDEEQKFPQSGNMIFSSSPTMGFWSFFSDTYETGELT